LIFTDKTWDYFLPLGCKDISFKFVNCITPKRPLEDRSFEKVFGQQLQCEDNRWPWAFPPSCDKLKINSAFSISGLNFCFCDMIEKHKCLTHGGVEA